MKNSAHLVIEIALASSEHCVLPNGASHFEGLPDVRLEGIVPGSAELRQSQSSKIA